MLRLFLTTFLLIIIPLIHSASINNFDNNNVSKNIHRRLDPIDTAGKYHLGWDVNFETNVITFNVVVETKGFVGFGISRGGGMTGADIVIGGVYDNGQSYFSDRHGVGNVEPVLDASQDYELTMVLENSTHTSLQFSRSLNTCDEQDVIITPDTMSLIWSYGETDVIQYHGGNRGTYSVNLLDPPMPPFDGSNLDKWVIVGNTTMPARDTSYWCSMHKTPDSYTSKRHLVAFNTLLESPESLKHTHHLTIYACRAPEGTNPDDIFGPLVGLEGGECHVPPEEQVIPIDYCREMLYVWAVGGKMMTFPEDVGYPIISNGLSEYYMLEIHYDNPEQLAGVRFESSIEVFNTAQLREHDAGVLLVAHALTFSHLIPANVENYVTVGHCSSSCTRDVLRPDGINLFNVMLHSHKAGRGLKLRHFRNRTELPWVAVDDNYDFDFQQNRPLREFRKVLPGDHLTTECTQSTTDRTGVTIAGLTTYNEMCQSIIWYFPADELRFCDSAYNEGMIMQRFGIQDIHWPNILLPPIILAPESMANKTYTEVLDTMVNWTPELIEELQQETRYNNHYQNTCAFSPIPSKDKLINWKKSSSKLNDEVIGYPELDQVYVPENPCARKESAPKLHQHDSEHKSQHHHH